MTRFVNFRASDIAPNPKEVMYWVDLEEDPLGGIIKYYDEELQYWTTIRILEGSIVKVEERIQKWVSEKLQEVNDEIDEKIKQFDGRILIIEGDIRELKEGKQDKLTAGYGIDIDENNVISCIIDTSLYEIVTELPKDNINSNKIYILIEPSADAVNLLEDITVSEYLHSITEDEVVLELYPQSATDSHNYIAFNRDISARFTISSNITDQSVIWDQRQPGQGFNFSLSTGGISSGYIHAKQGFSEITCDVVSGCIVTITVDSASKNQFTEYVYTGDRWEILGQDLTPFALDTDLQNEIKRAVEVETDLNIKINRETARAKAEEARIEKKAEDLVKAEQSRAEGVEADLQQQINDEVSRAKAEEARIEEKAEDLVEAESDRAKAAEKVNADAIAAEITRATTRENAIDSKLDTEIARAKQAEEELGDRITSTGDDLQTEINRAKAAEATLQANITAEQTRATTAEDAIRTNLTNEITRSTNEDNAIKARVTTAEGNISTIQTNLSPIKAAWDKQGQRDGLLVLGDNGLVKQANLPSYVDDVLDVYATYDKSATGVLSNIKLYKDSAKTQAVTPESGKIYIDVTGNYQFRWTGTQYVALGTPTVLGTITGTAYDGGEGNKNRQVLNSLPGTILTHTGTVNHNADNITWTNQQFVSKQADMTYGSEMTTTTKTFNAATTKLAGVMMPSDKVTITQARKIGAISHVKDDQAWTRSSTNVSLNFDCILPTSIENIVKHSVGIGAATTSLAGVMTAADKTKLDNLSAGTNSPYVKKSGDTMTGPLNLKGEQFDGNYALNLNNSDIIGVNNLVFADISNSPGEGVQFKRTNGNYDSLWAADGVLKFSPNGTRGTTSNYPATYKIWHEGNDGSGSGLDADMVDGVHVAGDGKNDGLMRAYSRGQFTTANRYFGNGTVVTIDPRPTDDTAGMLSANTTILSLGDTSIRNAQLAFLYENDNIRYRRCNDGGTSRWKRWRTIAFIDSNVASATKLQNSRTIWGQSFNGTANISGNMTGVGTISASGNVTAAGFVKSGSDNNHVLLAGGGTKALSTFASGGETNQNAYSIVKVGSTNVSATSKTDTLTLVAGSNVTITPDATNRKVTISATASPYTLPTATYAALGGIKLVDNTKQTVAANARTTTANRTYAVQLNNSNQAVVNVPWTDTNTTYGLASTTANGLLRQLTGSTVQFMRGDGNWSEPTRIINGTSRVSCAGSKASIAVAKSSIIDSIELNSVDHSVSINVATRFDIFIDGGAANFYMHAQGIETDVPVSSHGGFFDTSDARVKTNVKELDASKADKVRLVEFDRTDIEHHGYGVIAQELEEIYPEMVNTDKNGFKSVNYDELAMVKIKYLEDKIAKLENVINDLLNK